MRPMQRRRSLRLQGGPGSHHGAPPATADGLLERLNRRELVKQRDSFVFETVLSRLRWRLFFFQGDFLPCSVFCPARFCSDCRDAAVKSLDAASACLPKLARPRAEYVSFQCRVGFSSAVAPFQLSSDDREWCRVTFHCQSYALSGIKPGGHELLRTGRVPDTLKVENLTKFLPITPGRKCLAVVA